MGNPQNNRHSLLAAALILWLGTGTASANDPANHDRLEGYGFSLYDSLLYGEANGYSPLNLSLDTPLRLSGGFDRWQQVRTGGGHSLLWQDPEHGLISAIASYLEYGSEQYYRFGAEGQWYHGSLTASGRAGYTTGTSLLYQQAISHRFAGLDLRWYATDNLSFEIGGEQYQDMLLGNVTLGKLRLEYQPSFRSFNGLSFFAHAAAGDSYNEYILGGLRYSFGDTPSLLQRDRGDPEAAGLDRLSPYFRSLHLQR